MAKESLVVSNLFDDEPIPKQDNFVVEGLFDEAPDLAAQDLEKQHQAKIKAAEDQKAQAEAAAAQKAQAEADPANWTVDKVKAYYKENPPATPQEAAKANLAIMTKKKEEDELIDQMEKDRTIVQSLKEAFTFTPESAFKTVAGMGGAVAGVGNIPVEKAIEMAVGPEQIQKSKSIIGLVGAPVAAGVFATSAAVGPALERYTKGEKLRGKEILPDAVKGIIDNVAVLLGNKPDAPSIARAALLSVKDGGEALGIKLDTPEKQKLYAQMIEAGLYLAATPSVARGIKKGLTKVKDVGVEVGKIAGEDIKAAGQSVIQGVKNAPENLAAALREAQAAGAEQAELLAMRKSWIKEQIAAGKDPQVVARAANEIMKIIKEPAEGAGYEPDIIGFPKVKARVGIQQEAPVKEPVNLRDVIISEEHARIRAGEEVPRAGQPAAEAPVPGVKPNMAPGPETQVAPVSTIRTEDIKVAPEKYQFKLDVNKEGVQEPLKGEWNQFAAGNVLLYQTADGDLYALNGHHRVALAKEKGIETLNAQVIKEADGITPEEARGIAAETNILEGRGTVYDHAEYFRTNKTRTEADVKKYGISGQGFAIGRNTTDNTYAAFKAKTITPGAAEAIAKAAPGDDTLQAAGVQFASRNKRADPIEVESFVRAISKEKPVQKEGDLFGFDNSAIKLAEAKAKVVADRIVKLREEVASLRLAKSEKKMKIAKAYGIDVKDAQAVRLKIAEIEANIEKWEKWYQHPDIVQQISVQGEVVKKEKAAADHKAEMVAAQKELVVAKRKKDEAGQKKAREKIAQIKEKAPAPKEGGGISDKTYFHRTNKEFDIENIKPSEGGALGKGIYLSKGEQDMPSIGKNIHKVKIKGKLLKISYGETNEAIANLDKWVAKAKEGGYVGFDTDLSEIVIFDPKNIVSLSPKEGGGITKKYTRENVLEIIGRTSRYRAEGVGGATFEDQEGRVTTNNKTIKVELNDGQIFTFKREELPPEAVKTGMPKSDKTGDPELDAEVDQILKDLLSPAEYDELMKDRAQYFELLKNPTIKINTPERQALQNKIIDEEYNKDIANRLRNKIVDIIVGLPAAGKSKYVAAILAKINRAFLIDNDIYKHRPDMAADYKNGIGSGAVHDETANIIEPAILERAIANGDNIVLAKLGKNIKTMRELIARLKKAGYNVRFTLVDLDPLKAVRRSVTRFIEELPRRFLDPYYVAWIGLTPAENYDILKVEKGVDSYGKISTDVKKGEQVELVESSDNYPYKQSFRSRERGARQEADRGGREGAPEAKVAEAEAKIGAEVDKVLEDVAKAGRAGVVGPGAPSVRKARLDDTVTGVDTLTFGDKDTEARWKEARGIGIESLPAKLWQAVKDFFHQFKEFPHLSKDPKYAQIKNDLRMLAEATSIAKDKTLRIINHLTFKLGKNKLDLFTRKVVLDDLMYEASRDHDLPFGFTPETLKAEHEKITRLVDLNPDVKEALTNRATILEAVKKDLVAAGVMKEESFKNPTYFRHQVLEYFNAKRAGISKAKLEKKAGAYTKQRKGSELDINTDYLQAEFEWLASALKDIEIFKVIERLEKSPLNIKPKLEQEAKERNARAMVQAASESEAVADHLKAFKARMAIAFSKLRKLGYLPDAKDPDAAGFDNMAEIARIAQGAEGEEEEAVISARSLLKTISERKKYVKDTLGLDFRTWKDLIPEGYGLWQPKKGNLFMSGKSVTEAVLDRLMERIGSEVGITESDLRDVIIFGPKLKELVIPQELIDTIEDTFTTMPRSVLDKAIDMTFGRALTWWKKWILFSPMRAFKYNYQNFIGDLSGMIAGNPQAVTKIPQAIAELRAYFRGGAITDKLREAIDRAVIQTSLTLQEIPDIGDLDIFTRFKDRTLRDKLDLTKMWWTASTKFTRFREAILRYAVYLDYLEKIGTGEYGAGPFKAFKYGASKPEEVESLQDPRDKAAKLSRELMVDYGAISPAGKWLRKYAIPFYSWLEGNLKRYNRLFANAASEGAGKGRVRKVAGAQAAAQGAMLAGMWAMRFMLFYAAAQLFNLLFHKEEEKQISEYDKRRLHIVLGTDPETNDIIVLRGQDAFGDYAEWFGLNELPSLLEQYQSGQISIQDLAWDIARSPIAKALNGIGPHIKMPLGMVTGRELDPSTMKIMTIRDKGRYLARTLAMEDLYNELAGKPTRGMGKAVEKGFISRQDPDENAYNYILNKKGEWGKKMGRGGAGDYFTPRSTFYADYKKALKYGDRKAAINALKELKALGVKKRDLKRSLETADPLYGIPKKEKKAFVNKFLSAEDRQKLIRAVRYYRRVFKGQK